MTRVRSDLAQYLRFEISLAELRARLGVNWHFEREGHSFELSGDVTVDKPVEVDFDAVINAINLLLRDKVSVGSVEEWANLLLLSDVYAIGSRRDENERETLLQCIHELASPSLFGGLNSEHLLELKRKAHA